MKRRPRCPVYRQFSCHELVWCWRRVSVSARRRRLLNFFKRTALPISLWTWVWRQWAHLAKRLMLISCAVVVSLMTLLEQHSVSDCSGTEQHVGWRNTSVRRDLISEPEISFCAFLCNNRWTGLDYRQAYWRRVPGGYWRSLSVGVRGLTERGDKKSVLQKFVSGRNILTTHCVHWIHLNSQLLPAATTDVCMSFVAY